MENVCENEVVFACILWGDKYDPNYVEKLAHAITSNSDLQCPLICISDRKTISASVSSRIIFKQTPNDFPGWWQKINLFDRSLIGYRYVIFLDLDVVILNNIDSVLSIIGRHDLVYAQDLIDPISSSFMIIDTESQLARDVIRNFEPEKWAQPELFDQWYLARFLDRRLYRLHDLHPKDHYSYKYLIHYGDWRAKTTNSKYQTVPLDQIRMLNFHGVPKPHDLARYPEKWPLAEMILANW